MAHIPQNTHEFQERISFHNGLELHVMLNKNGSLADFWELNIPQKKFFRTLEEAEDFISSITLEEIRFNSYHKFFAYSRNYRNYSI